MLAHARRFFAESLLWFSRRQTVDLLNERLAVAFEARFRRQMYHFLRAGIPELEERGFFESKRDDITASLKALQDFTDPHMPDVYQSTITAAMDGGAARVSMDIGHTTMKLVGDHVLDYLKNHSAEDLGKDVDRVTAELVRKRLVQGAQEGWTRARTVREIKALYTGFTARTGGTIRNRAELIAITEIGNAYSAGALAMAHEIQATGQEVEIAWAVSANACPICDPNAAAGWIPLGKNFPSGHSRPLAHPRCRCSLLTRAKPQKPVIV